MRKVVAGLAMTLDGVVEGPSIRGWLMFNEEMGQIIGASVGRSDAILLGRETYLEFSGRWPGLGSDVPMADFMNNTPKYVLSTTLEKLDWANSTLLSGDLRDVVGKLKDQQGKEIQVPGSPRLVRDLILAGLLDELSLMVHPLVLGTGMKLFDDVHTELKLDLAQSRALSNGVLALTYRPRNA